MGLILTTEKDRDLEGTNEDIIILDGIRHGRTRRSELRCILDKGPEVFRRKSRSTYDKWIDTLIEEGLVEDNGSTLRLTKLGRWIHDSHLGTFNQRLRLARDMICERCRKPPTNRLVFVEPMLQRKTSKGFRVDAECPVCKKHPGSTPEHPESSNIHTEEFHDWEEFELLCSLAKREIADLSRRSS